MSKTYNIERLDPLRFMARMEERQKKIAEAPAKEITSDYEVNKLADALHPQKQFVRIQEFCTDSGFGKRNKESGLFQRRTISYRIS